MDVNKILSNKVDKVNFLKGLIRIANADGVKDNAEIVYYHQTATALGLGDADLEEISLAWNAKADSITLEFTNDEAKMFFIIEAIQLCWIDGSYSIVEQDEIRNIAAEINISEGAVNSVEKWVEEGMEWNKRGEELLVLS